VPGAGRLPQRLLGLAAGRWRQPSARAQTVARLAEQICTIYQASRGTYGVPRVHAELVATGTRCGHKRVARLMRGAGLVGFHRRRPLQTTRREPTAEPAPDRVQRTFAASAPNQLWMADITYVPTQCEGFLYLAVILDVLCRRVVGWSMAANRHTELVVGTLELAIWNRRPRMASSTIPTIAVSTPRRSSSNAPGGGHPLLHGVGRRLV